MHAYAQNFELKERILGNARMDVIIHKWEDHFFAVSISAKTEMGEEVAVQIGATTWSQACKTLTKFERLALLTLITSKQVVDYTLPVSVETELFHQLFS